VIPVNRPLLPSYDRLAPYLREIDANRYYSNYGPLHSQLRARLAAHFGAGPDQLALANSGTSALIGLILAMVGRATAARPYCLMPSYTFVATAVAAESCGYQPHFMDVVTSTWALDPLVVEKSSMLPMAGLVVAVCPYGRMVDIEAWQGFAGRTGVPVIIDAAAFDGR
jgi:dTDP-4-amino-4,6-dideoxygalactose transaminase